MSLHNSFSMRQKPRGLFKWLLRLPVWLFRARLGFLFGDRFCVIVHRGRRSGLIRRTAVEIVEHDPTAEEYVVCSGTGPNADWYRNLRAQPARELWVGRVHRVRRLTRAGPEHAAPAPALCSVTRRPGIRRAVRSEADITAGEATGLSLPAENRSVIPTGGPDPMLRLQVPLPDRYTAASPDELEDWIRDAKHTLGDDVVILGHHYQRDEVIRFADFTGDSLKLSRQAATRAGARFIVFCGVHFMAESADVLAAPGQQVILPDLAAGCSMADMAAIDQLETCWDELEAAGVTGVLPVTYINSAAAIKAFCGEHGGATCTSSNAAAVMAWGWRRRPRAADAARPAPGPQHRPAMGVPLDEMVVWDPHEPLGGSTPDDLGARAVLLWKGHCSVHERFTARSIDRFRAAHPAGRVIVHPECTFDVVQAADESGSTERIIDRVDPAPRRAGLGRGHRGAPGEPHGARAAPDRTVVSARPARLPVLDDVPRLAPTCLGARVARRRRVHNRIVVPETAEWARAALDRMLDIT